MIDVDVAASGKILRVDIANELGNARNDGPENIFEDIANAARLELLEVYVPIAQESNQMIDVDVAASGKILRVDIANELGNARNDGPENIFEDIANAARLELLEVYVPIAQESNQMIDVDVAASGKILRVDIANELGNARNDGPENIFEDIANAARLELLEVYVPIAQESNQMIDVDVAATGKILRVDIANELGNARNDGPEKIFEDIANAARLELLEVYVPIAQESNQMIDVDVAATGELLGDE